MMHDYDKKDYCVLSSHGFRVLADAVEAGRPYEIDCPLLVICGEKDGAVRQALQPRVGKARRPCRALDRGRGAQLVLR